MKNRKITKRIIDILMAGFLLLLMARQVTGDTAHEWIGAGMFLLWIAHHILNRNWYKSIWKNRYTQVRIFRLVINLALFIAMLGVMYSGIVLSRKVFFFLPVHRGIGVARAVHIVTSYWSFVLMALHLGMHWSIVIGRFNGKKKTSRNQVGYQTWILRILAVGIAIYGLYAFIHNDILLYMFYRSHFVFYDYEKPTILLWTEYVTMMGFFICVSYYGERWLQRLQNKKAKV